MGERGSAGFDAYTAEFFLDGRRVFVVPLRQRLVIGRSDACDVALPSAMISREHAALTMERDCWWVEDLSKHGVTVGGRPVEGRRKLNAGDVLGIGPFAVQIRRGVDELRHARTLSAARLHSQPADEILGVEGGRLSTEQAVLRVVAGPQVGERLLLEKPRLSIGGPGSDIVFSAELPRHALRLWVSRGRVTIEPGKVPVLLVGERVRTVTPAHPGEQIDIAGHGFVVETEVGQAAGASSFGRMVGRSAVMRDLFGTLARLASSDLTVLLVGESGTGKGIAARGLHSQSDRADGPFVHVNCAAVAEGLFESELFGVEAGAYTGADRSRDGAFQRAHGGVLFLDEIGDLSLERQAKLLTALDPGTTIRRVGGGEDDAPPPDVRIVAATNRDLAAMVHKGQFRLDLYHRLAVVRLEVPPLRDRVEDIVPLAQAVLKQERGLTATFDPLAVAKLEAYAWPGNVRELTNLLSRATLIHGPHLRAEHLEMEASDVTVAPGGVDVDVGALERERYIAALKEAGGNVSEVARALKMPRSTLSYRLKILGIKTHR